MNYANMSMRQLMLALNEAEDPKDKAIIVSYMKKLDKAIIETKRKIIK